MAELGRLVKAGAVNLTAEPAAGAPFKLDAAAVVAQPCRPQACRALPHRVLTHRMQLDRALYLGLLCERWGGAWRRRGGLQRT